jgi:hypothetical protein
MADVARPGMNLAQLVASVPRSPLVARDPYAGFGYALGAAPLQSGAADYGWRDALANQLASKQARPSLPRSASANPANANSDHPLARLFATQIGHFAASIVGNETQTLAQFGTVAAETLAAAMALTSRDSLRQREIWTDEDTRTLVVPGDTASGEPPTVLLLDPVASPEPERVTDRVVLLPKALEDARARLCGNSLDEPGISPVDRLVFGGSPDALLTALWIARPEVIRVRKPEMESLACPSPGIQVRAGVEKSSMGMFCRDPNGIAGFTACYHGTGPSGTAITLGDLETTVTLASQVQDLVFAPLPAGYVVPNFARGIAGIRRGRAPAQNDPANFDGCTSGAMTTYVISHDAGLLRTRASVQLKVQTTADLNRGDSGTALIDTNDNVIAFAFERTAISERIQFADWIWAANAYDALDLRPY